MAAPQFHVSPQKQASFPRYMYHQVAAKPQVIKDVDLHGRTALVTGSNCGVGLETSRQLLHLGVSKLILAVRDEEKGRAAAADLLADRKDTPPDTIEVWKLDLSVYDSVVSFAERVAKTLTRLDIAILNAGFCPAKRIVNTSTGHDEIIQVNYLSTALLAVLLLPVAKRVRNNQPATGDTDHVDLVRGSRVGALPGRKGRSHPGSTRRPRRARREHERPHVRIKAPVQIFC